MLTTHEKQVLVDRLEGWELVEFLQVSVEEVLFAALENDWINEYNLDDLLEFLDLKDKDDK